MVRPSKAKPGREEEDGETGAPGFATREDDKRREATERVGQSVATRRLGFPDVVQR